jgi:hypothetical protein
VETPNLESAHPNVGVPAVPAVGFVARRGPGAAG